MLTTAYRNQIKQLDECENPYTSDYKERISLLKVKLQKIERISKN